MMRGEWHLAWPRGMQCPVTILNRPGAALGAHTAGLQLTQALSGCPQAEVLQRPCVRALAALLLGALVLVRALAVARTGLRSH